MCHLKGDASKLPGTHEKGTEPWTLGWMAQFWGLLCPELGSPPFRVLICQHQRGVGPSLLPLVPPPPGEEPQLP